MDDSGDDCENKRGHRVPLSTTAMDILTDLTPETVAPDAFVLAGARGRRQQSDAAATFSVQISAVTICGAVRRR